jgi:hypothetical protein
MLGLMGWRILQFGPLAAGVALHAIALAAILSVPMVSRL